jgi:EpsI family protein
MIAVGADSVEINRYELANKQARALVYYWYQGRGRVAASEYQVKWDLLRDAAISGRSEEALVRLVIPLTDSMKDPDALARRVAAEMVREVERKLPTAA